MKDIRQLEKEGYEGPDAGIAESLFEYGVIWKFDKDENEYKFIYKHPTLHERYDFATFKADEMTFDVFDWADKHELEHVFDWANKDDQEVYIGAMPSEGTPEFLYELYAFYGAENVFGTSYDEGVYIFDSEQYGGVYEPEGVLWLPIGDIDKTCQSIFIEESGVQDGITWFRASIEDTRKFKPVEILGHSPDLDVLITFCSTLADELTELEEKRDDLLYEAVQEMRELGR